MVAPGRQCCGCDFPPGGSLASGVCDSQCTQTTPEILQITFADIVASGHVASTPIVGCTISGGALIACSHTLNGTYQFGSEGGVWDESTNNCSVVNQSATFDAHITDTFDCPTVGGPAEFVININFGITLDGDDSFWELTAKSCTDCVSPGTFATRPAWAFYARRQIGTESCYNNYSMVNLIQTPYCTTNYYARCGWTSTPNTDANIAAGRTGCNFATGGKAIVTWTGP